MLIMEWDWCDSDNLHMQTAQLIWKRKKMIHERGKLKDERQWFVNVEGKKKMAVS